MAKEYHAELKNRGEKSFLAISDNESAADEIRAFKKTRNGCLVTCAMAYEGLDHKPLSHVICLTHIRSTPWIEQALARVWRSSPGKPKCFAFVPDDPRMNRVIDEIRREQPDEKLDAGGGGGGGGAMERDSIPIGSAHAFTRQTGLDEDVEACRLNKRQIEAVEALTALGIPESSDAIQAVIKELSGHDEPSINGNITAKERESALRNSIAQDCRAIDKAKDRKYGTTQKLLFRRNGKSICDMTEEELRRVKSYVSSILP